jgi:hypothetical protein
MHTCRSKKQLKALNCNSDREQGEPEVLKFAAESLRQLLGLQRKSRLISKEPMILVYDACKKK